jgi:multidrug efflux pump subunit AcrA (membrane-fusion protein)
MPYHAGRTLLGTALFAAVATAGAGLSSAADEVPPPLRSAVVISGGLAESTGFDGVVQAVRQTVMAAQVSGAVVSLDVKAGDVVRAGQVLLRLDARAAEQTAAAGAAQVQGARAAQDAATKEFERQKLLFQKNYISQAALDRAEAQYKTSQAEAAAQLASAGAARAGRAPGAAAGGHRLPGLRGHGGADQLQRPRAAVLPARGRRGRRPAGEPR